MLAQRYANDGLATVPLNPLQQRMKKQIDRKVAEGHYCFEFVPCAVCDGIDFVPLAEKDRYGLYFSVVVCRACGLVQTNPRMDEAAYAEFYTAEYRKLYGGEEHPSEAFFLEQYGRGRRIYQWLMDDNLLPLDKANPFVLEVGCGAGGILHYFREQDWQVMGIDVGGEYLAYGRDRHRLDLREGSVESIVDVRPPDLVIYSHVLEHILNPIRELAAVRPLLADDGILYIEIPGIKNLTNSYEMNFLELLQNAHIYHFTLTTLTNLLGRCGFGRVAGSEFVWAVFRKGAVTPPTSDYPAVVDYLVRLEKMRRLWPIPPYLIKSRMKEIAVRSLRATGFLDQAMRIYKSRRRR